MSVKIIGENRKDIPWEARPANDNNIMWRYSKNPIIGRHMTPTSNSIFNSAAVTFKDGFAGVFRIDDKRRNQQLHIGFSDNGVDWKIEPEPFLTEPEEYSAGHMTTAYDPRVSFIEDRYYITWCNVQNGPTIGIAYTYDFKKIVQLPNAFPPYNRNGVLFPRKINGKYAMYNRPSDNGHTPFGDIYYCESPDLRHWGYHREVMKTTTGWQATKIGAGPNPIETTEGWLLFYHGVLNSCNGFTYSIGAALLDIDEPWKVIYRNESYLLAPQELYECVGDVPNVAFPCSALTDAETGRIALYYGCADSVTGLAFCQVDELLDYLKKDSKKY